MSMRLSAHDEAQLQRALVLAEGAIGVSEPNPRVGCVLQDASGVTIGEGHTQAAGSAHAEVMALRAAQASGRSTTGGTAYVTLEPCAHHGRTPPCADALVAAGLHRVVVLMTDPFHAVAGRGVSRLREAGIRVDLAAPGPLVRAGTRLNEGFFSRVLRGRPWVRLKMAGSLDGRSALEDGRSQWITSPEARTDGHAWRKRAGALLTGIGTVLDDDPRLDVRLVQTVLQPLRVVLDSEFRTPPNARLLAAPGQALIVGTREVPQRMAALREAGASVRCVPGPDGQVDLHALLSSLAAEGVNELHVEAGARLNGALLAAGLVDEVLLYQAPMFIGPGRGLAQLPALAQLQDALAWRFEQVDVVGPDLRLLLRPAPAAA